MASYILTKAAEEDLISIWRYTFKTWGEKQADHYFNLMELGCETLNEKKVLWKSFDELYPDLKYFHCEHHYLFFLPNEDKKPIIIAILHERMNILKKLKKRLGE